MILSTQHLIGIMATFALFTGLGIYSGRKVKTTNDFSVSGKRAGSVLVAGTILGTMIGGASTIGTAQMAFAGGLSAWWFTLGGGISLFLMAVFFVRPFRRLKHDTIPHIIQDAYGSKTAIYATFYIAVGMFINIIPQIISVAALLSSFFAGSARVASLAAVLLMAIYVYFGGLWSAGILGIMKTVLSAVSILGGGLLALWLFGGLRAMTASFPTYPWFSLLSNGVSNDIASLTSLIVGVLTGQVYLQAIMAAKNIQSARMGALAGMVASPLIGLGGVLIGLFMRAHHPEIQAVQALPLFVLYYLPPLPAGIVLATLLLAIIGTGAGLALGICTILTRDIYQNYISPYAEDRQILSMFRYLLAGFLLFSFIVVFAIGENTMILNLSYLSLALRGVAVFLPLVTALFLRGKINENSAAVSSALAPVAAAAWLLFRPLPIEPLYLGLFISLCLFMWGYYKKRQQPAAANWTHNTKGS